MKELYSCFNGYRKQLVLGPLFKLTEAILELMVPLLMADIIDVGIRNGDRSYVVTHGLFMLLLGAIGLGCAMICQYFAAVCAQGFGRSLRQKLFRHVFSLSQKGVRRHRNRFSDHTADQRCKSGADRGEYVHPSGGARTVSDGGFH